MAGIEDRTEVIKQAEADTVSMSAAMFLGEKKMANLEPSWNSIGHSIQKHLERYIPEGKHREAIFEVIGRMAMISHLARAEQIRKQFVDGEISQDWVNEIYSHQLSHEPLTIRQLFYQSVGR